MLGLQVEDDPVEFLAVHRPHCARIAVDQIRGQISRVSWHNFVVGAIARVIASPIGARFQRGVGHGSCDLLSRDCIQIDKLGFGENTHWKKRRVGHDLSSPGITKESSLSYLSWPRDKPRLPNRLFAWRSCWESKLNEWIMENSNKILTQHFRRKVLVTNFSFSVQQIRTCAVLS